MRYLLLFLLTGSLFASINESVMLDAIAAVETGNRADVIGAHQEKGMWQLTPSVAQQVGGYDRDAAHRWLRIIIVDMKRARIHVCPVNIYLVWNAGIGSVKRSQVPVISYERADRVENVYQSHLVRALGRPLNKPREILLTPPMFSVPSAP